MFLTRFPIPSSEYSEAALGKSVVYFPLIGVLVGLAGSATYLLAQLIWSGSIACALTLLVMVLCTGGFHEDGLADTADGIGGGWTIEDKLRIMKDSRIGTYGALALMLAILLKYTALVSLDSSVVPAALIVGHALGRWSILPLVRFTNYVSGDGGSGKALVGSVTAGRFSIATLFLVALAASLALNQVLVLIIVTAVILGVSRWYFRRKIGGITGDTLGAINQLIELSVYLVFAAGV